MPRAEKREAFASQTMGDYLQSCFDLIHDRLHSGVAGPVRITLRVTRLATGRNCRRPTWSKESIMCGSPETRSRAASASKQRKGRARIFTTWPWSRSNKSTKGVGERMKRKGNRGSRYLFGRGQGDSWRAQVSNAACRVCRDVDPHIKPGTRQLSGVALGPAA